MTPQDLHALFASGRAPEGLVIKGDLVLAGTRVRALPARLTVRGDLDLRRCERLHRIGPGLKVGGDLRIGGTCPDLRSVAVRGFPAAWESRDKTTPLAALPDDLEVGGSLEIRHAQRLERLPKGLQVGGSIILIGCRSLAALPESLEVQDDLVILGGPRLAALPSYLYVGRDLRITATAITALPDMLIVGRHMVLTRMRRLTRIGETDCKGDVTIHGFQGEELPPRLEVRGNLSLHGAPRLRATPVGLAVGGTLHVSGAPELTTLAPGLFVGRHLDARDCPKLVSLPDHLNVPDTLDLRGCTALSALPRALRCGRLMLADCASLETVPRDLHVDQPIELAGTSIRRWPSELAKHEVRFRGVRIEPEVIFEPEKLPPERILGALNAEMRRVMLDRAGITRVLAAAGATTIDADRDAGGERRLVEVRLARTGERDAFLARYLDCRCPSTGRRYLLGVPPRVRTCRAAAAWLAGFDNPADYAPLAET